MRYNGDLTTFTLITGASGGLGEEFARLAASDKRNLVLIARSKDQLERIATELRTKHAIEILVIAQDLSKPDAVTSMMKLLEEKKILIDCLINNAGFGAYGLFHETPFEHEQNLIDVNIMALTELTKRLLPGMVQRKNGKILNVASTAAFQPGPLMAVYYASKAYVLNFSLALSEELRGTGVTVTCVCPGPTKTGFQKKSGMAKSRLFITGVMDAKTVTRIGYQAMLRGKALVIPGIHNTVGAFCTRFVSRIFAARVAKRIQSPTT